MKEKFEVSPCLKEDTRRKIRERVKIHRQNKKFGKGKFSGLVDSPIGTYKCCQTFGKAVNKVKRSLPNSPNKTAAVLKNIVVDVIGSEVLVKTPNQKIAQC